MNERRTRSQSNTLNKENSENATKRTNITTRKAFGDISNRVTQKEIKTPILKETRQVIIPQQLLSPGYDKMNSEDPQECAEYVKDIFDHFSKHELKYLPKIDFLKKQPEIQWNMRNVLVDWMIDVIIKFELSAETLWLTFNLLDRFLECTQITKSKFQLCGTTCMWIAAKYEEIYVPEVKEFVEICANAYSKEDVLKMEKSILVALEFNLTVATPLVFMQRFIGVSRSEGNVGHLACFVLEKSLLDSNLISTRPSLLAASCLYYARRRNHLGWSFDLMHYSHYREEDLKECVNYLNLMMKTPLKLNAIDKKYASSKRGSVSINL
jgi:hypothetical protein